MVGDELPLVHDASLAPVVASACESALVVTSLLCLSLFLDGGNLYGASRHCQSCRDGRHDQVGRRGDAPHDRRIGRDSAQRRLRDGLRHLHVGFLASVFRLNFRQFLLLLVLELPCQSRVLPGMLDHAVVLSLCHLLLVIGLRGVIRRHGAHDRRYRFVRLLELLPHLVHHVSRCLSHCRHCLLVRDDAICLHLPDVLHDRREPRDVGSEVIGDRLTVGMVVLIVSLGVVGSRLVRHVHPALELLALGVVQVLLALTPFELPLHLFAILRVFLGDLRLALLVLLVLQLTPFVQALHLLEFVPLHPLEPVDRQRLLLLHVLFAIFLLQLREQLLIMPRVLNLVHALSLLDLRLEVKVFLRSLVVKPLSLHERILLVLVQRLVERLLVLIERLSFLLVLALQLQGNGVVPVPYLLFGHAAHVIVVLHEEFLLFSEQRLGFFRLRAIDAYLLVERLRLEVLFLFSERSQVDLPLRVLAVVLHQLRVGERLLRLYGILEFFLSQCLLLALQCLLLTFGIGLRLKGFAAATTVAIGVIPFRIRSFTTALLCRQLRYLFQFLVVHILEELLLPVQLFQVGVKVNLKLLVFASMVRDQFQGAIFPFDEVRVFEEAFCEG